MASLKSLIELGVDEPKEWLGMIMGSGPGLHLITGRIGTEHQNKILFALAREMGALQRKTIILMHNDTEDITTQDAREFLDLMVVHAHAKMEIFSDAPDLVIMPELRFPSQLLLINDLTEAGLIVVGGISAFNADHAMQRLRSLCDQYSNIDFQVHSALLGLTLGS